MDKCLYNGKILNSFEVAGSFDLETEIRSCSTLKCCDPNCKSLVRYKHGPVRRPYFAHISASSDCDYDRYSRKKSELFKDVQKMLYEQLKSKYGKAVEVDIKLMNNPVHYISLLLSGNKKNFAVDITDKRITANTLIMRKEIYKSAGYIGMQIIIDKAYNTDLNERYDMYYPVKFELNNSENNSAIVIDRETKQLCYMRLDKSEYQHCDGDYNYLEEVNLFARFFDITELELSIDGFIVNRLEREYSEWLAERKKRYSEYLDTKQKESEVLLKSSKDCEEILADDQSKNRIVYTYNKQRSTISKLHKQSFDSILFHKETGRYAGEVIKGERESFTLEEITIKKGIPNYFGVFTDEKMRQCINNAFDYTVSNILKLMNKMYHANNGEKAIFVEVYEEYLNAEPTYDNRERLKILEYVIKEAEIFV